MIQPTQMASDQDIMITQTHACTNALMKKHTVKGFFLKAKTTFLTYQKDKVETGERLEMGAEFCCQNT